MKSICLLGSTGSVGRQTLDIVQAHQDEFKILALAAGTKNLALLARQIAEFSPELVSVPDEAAAGELRTLLLNHKGRLPCIVTGDEGLCMVASHKDVHTVVVAVVGFLGLKPTVAAIQKGKTILLANKETLVVAGATIMPMVKEHGACVLPVDSEHSAVFQSLAGRPATDDIDQDVSAIWLTASGGPMRTWTKEQIRNATAHDALKHPNWAMGPKITIDSATLMNKGLEVIEARWLFGLHPDKIKVVIHPQSILHSAVEFTDGSVIGQMGMPDMRLPIHYALFHPRRVSCDLIPRLNLMDIGQLTFEEPDMERFPCLALARSVADGNDTRPCVLNAANEVAVDAFLQGYVKFFQIAHCIERVLDRHKPVLYPSMDDILESDRWSRLVAKEILQGSPSRGAAR